MNTGEWKNRWIEVNEIVIESLELDEPQRHDFIRERCRNAPEMLFEVEALLASESAAEDFFSEPAAVNYASFLNVEDHPEARAGQKIGVYKIIREIGHGGMGAVYLAERADGNFDQQVALKLLKRELNTDDPRRRFRYERQILASLQHPNIARLLDAGTTADGIPFLAMEYIQGLPVDVFCDSQNYNLEQRLKIFRAICEAVAFAHRNLVVHRDLKPSNILVTDDGIPKLLDFGISKLLTAEFEAQSDHTITRLGAMTPTYASPEQLKSGNVQTTSDVYSLGVILYELLSGHRPFESLEGNLQKIIQAVCEVEPPPPSAITPIKNSSIEQEIYDEASLKFGAPYESANVKNGFADQTQSHKLRQTNPQFVFSNPQRLKGDLDNIVLKALKKEPERRYSSVDLFSEDVRRHLEGLPVMARRDTFLYRTEKLIKRHRTGVAAFILVLLLITGGIIAVLWQSRIAASERDRARLEAMKARKTTEYMKNVLNFSNPNWLSSNPKRNREATIANALDEALKNIDTDLANEPEVQAEILMTIGQTYLAQGQYDKTIKLMPQAIEKFEQVHGGESGKSMEATELLSSAWYMLGKYDEAEKLYTKVLNYLRPRIAEDESLSKPMAIALNNLANIHNYNSNFDEAEKLYREGLELSKNFTGKDRFIIPILLGNLAWRLNSQGKFDEATVYYNQAVEEIRKAGNEEELESGTLFNKIGVGYTEMGDYAQADKYFQKASVILTKTVGEENYYTVLVMYRTAYNYYKSGRIEESENLVNKSLKIQQKLFPNGHNITAYSERLLGELYTAKGDLKKGEEFLRKALDYLLKKTKEPNRDISLAKLSLGENLIAQKRFAEAREMTTAALESSIKIVGENHPQTKRCRAVLNQVPNQ